MKCQICDYNEIDQTTLVFNKEYYICGWCSYNLSSLVDCASKNSVINIFWGAGRVSWGEWEVIRTFLRKHNITEVFELGSGLSSELFINEGIKLTSGDILPYHINTFTKHPYYSTRGKFFCYDWNNFPQFDRQWEYVFVDGPQERSREVKKAMELSSRFIHLHDPNLGEQSFFPNEIWRPLPDNDRIFEKVA